MLKKLALMSLVVSFLGMTSCETDFSLNGDYQLTPVVFGLLDQNDSIHMIKITKAFLGDGNNLEYAQIADSSYFKQVDARIVELNESGNATGRSWDLKDSIITGKSTDGVFYAPDQKIYYFEANDLVGTYSYRLEADLNEGELSITAETSLINGFVVPNSIKNLIATVNLAQFTVVDDGDYLSMSFDFNSLVNAANSEMGYTVNWTEYYLDGDSASFSRRKFETRSDDASKVMFLSGLDFYKWVGETVPDDDQVDYRTFDGIDIHFAFGHEVLKQFMDVSDPVSGVAQIQPIFTNINGGYGLLSARFQYTRYGLPLASSSAKELREGRYTNTKKFI